MKKTCIASFIVSSILLSSCGVQNHLAGSDSKGNNSRFLNNVSLNNGDRSTFEMKNNEVHYGDESRDQNRSVRFSNGKGVCIKDDVYTTNISLADFIKDWMGVKYRLGGNDKTGIDCSAFTKCLYAQVYGISLMRTAFNQFSTSLPIYDPDSLREGDLVFFKIGGKYISHVGVYLSQGYFVQAAGSGVMISNLKESYWSRYFFAGGRVKSELLSNN